MKIFSALYQKMIRLSRHPHAPIYLFCLSFAESSVFPIPPDVMLAPMTLAKPENAWRYATITTLASVLGGIFGYFLGVFFLKIIYPVIINMGLSESFQHVVYWFKIWGFWLILITGFSPIPYKIFTIASGAVGMPIVPFILGSCISRGSRFFLVSALMFWGGKEMERVLNKYIDKAVWVLLGVVIIINLVYFIFRG